MSSSPAPTSSPTPSVATLVDKLSIHDTTTADEPQQPSRTYEKTHRFPNLDDPDAGPGDVLISVETSVANTYRLFSVHSAYIGKHSPFFKQIFEEIDSGCLEPNTDEERIYHIEISLGSVDEKIVVFSSQSSSSGSPPPFKTFIPALPLGLSTAADQIPTTKEHLLQSFTRVLMGMHHRPMPKFGKNVEFLCTVGLTVAFGLLPILRIPLQALVLESRGDHSARLHPLSFTIAAYHLQSTRLMRESMTHLVRWLMAAKIPDYLAAIQRIRDECDNATAELVQKEVMTVERNLTQLLKKTVVIVTREKGGYQIDYSGVSLEPGEEREFMSRYDGLGYGKKATRELEPELSLLKTNNSIHPVGTDVGLTCTYVRDADMPWTMPRWPEDDGA